MSKATDLSHLNDLTDLEGITDGTNGQVLTTDGSGSFSFQDASGGVTSVDGNTGAVTTLQLGTTSTTALAGDTSLFSGAYNDLTGKPTLLTLGTTSTTALAGDTSIPANLTDLSISDGTNGQVLTTNGSGTFTFEDAASPYGDTEVSAHLNTSTATTDDILSWNGSDFEWVDSAALMTTYKYTATASQTTFSGADDASNTLAYTAGNIIVTVNGVTFEDGTDYTATNGTSVVFTPARSLNDEVNIIAFTVRDLTNIDYSEVSNTPTIPTELTDLSISDGTNNQVLTTNGSGTFTFEDAVSDFASLTGKPTTISGYGITDALAIGTTATTALAGNTSLFSGAYADLTGKPTLLTLGTTSTTALAGDTSLFSGAYADLTGTPTLPTDFVSAASGGTFSGNVAMTGDLTVDTDTLYVDSTNNRVGIGTTSPESALHVNSGSTNTAVTIESTDAACWQVMRDPTADIFFGNTGGDYAVFTGGAERMRIDSSGNVGIGESNPDGLLHLTGDTNSNGAELYLQVNNNNTTDNLGAIHFGNSVDSTLSMIRGSTAAANNSSYLSFYNSATGTQTERMRLETDGDLHVDGNVVAYSTTISDIRLKKDVAPIEDAVTKVQQLNGCTFTYLKDDRKSAGLIAQDVEKVLPSAVIEDKPVFHGEEGETYKTVQYDQVIGLLVEAVKELKAEIEELKNGSSN